MRYIKGKHSHDLALIMHIPHPPVRGYTARWEILDNPRRCLSIPARASSPLCRDPRVSSTLWYSRDWLGKVMANATSWVILSVLLRTPLRLTMDECGPRRCCYEVSC